MKQMKNNLDEMQELKLLKIEHTSYTIAFWALAISILAQTFMRHNSFEYLAGEYIVFIPLCLYISVTCIKNGIWDRRLKPDSKTNLKLSSLIGIILGFLCFVSSYQNYHNLFGSLAAGAFMFFFTGVPSFAALSIIRKIYMKRKQVLESEDESSEK